MTNQKSKFLRAAEWLDAIPARAKGWAVPRWPVIVAIVVVIICLIVCSYLLAERFRPDAALVDQVQAEIMEGIQAERETRDAKIEALEAELFELREQISEIDARVDASIIEREETHNEIKNARTVSGVSAVLKRRGITGPGSTKQTAGADTSTGGVDANPYH